MKTKIRLTLSVVAVGMLLISACKRNEPITFDKDFTGIYFQTDSTHYSFGLTSLSIQNYELRIPVSIMGEPTDADRIFKVQIVPERTTAIAGVHYTLIDDCVIKKDSVNGYFTVNVLRNELKGKDFKVFFKLLAEGGFSPATEGLKTKMVQFNDKLEKPAFWPSQLGVWSTVKHIKYIEIFRMMEEKAPLTYAAIIKEHGVDMSKAKAWPFTYANSMVKYVTIPLYQYFVEQNPGLGITIPKPAGY